MKTGQLNALCGREDPLAGFFYQGRRWFSDMNHHILILDQCPDKAEFMSAAEHILRELGDEICQPGLLHASALLSINELDTEIADLKSSAFRSHLMNQAFSCDPQGKSPLFRLLLLTGKRDKRSCIYLGISHAIADIQAARQILHRLAGVYRQRMAGDFSEIRSTPWMPLKMVLPDWNRPVVRHKRQLLTHLTMPGKLIFAKRTRAGLPAVSTQGLYVADDIDFRHQPLSADLHNHVLTYAKREKISVNAVFSAALVIWLRSVLPEDNGTHFTMAVNLRGMPCWPEKNGIRSGMVNASLSIPSALSDAELCREISQQTADLKTVQGIQPAMALMENAEGLMRSPLPPSIVYKLMNLAQTSNVLYSNPGRTDGLLELFGETRVLNWCEFGCLVPPYKLMFLTPQLNQRLQLDVVFSRKCFPDIDMMFIQPFLKALSGLVLADQPHSAPLAA